MFKVHLINFGTTREFATADEAIAFTRKACFEASITRNGEMYASFSPICGLRRLAAEA